MTVKTHEEEVVDTAHCETQDMVHKANIVFTYIGQETGVTVDS